MTNNFLDIQKYISRKLDDKLKDKYFIVKIIRRGKDWPELKGKGANRIFQSYYIDSVEKFENVIPEIMLMCDTFGCRAYISCGYYDKETVTKNLLMKCAERICANDYQSPHRLAVSTLESECTEKLWVLDIDNTDVYDDRLYWLYNNDDIKIQCHVGSKTGSNIIVKPFNTEKVCTEYKKEFNEELDIKKRWFVLLYENINNQKQ